MPERTTYTIMLENPQTGKFTPISRPYVQRASAFKRARSVAKYNHGRRVRVWEYRGPGDAGPANSVWHEVTAA
jgi:hypothetical protein